MIKFGFKMCSDSVYVYKGNYANTVIHPRKTAYRPLCYKTQSIIISYHEFQIILGLASLD